MNESKTSTKDISCECKCKFDGRKCNSDQWWNNDKCPCECKKRHVCEKDYVCNPAAYSCQNGKYLASIVDDSAILCDEIIESYDEETNFDEKEAFLLITIALLIAVSIYCYLIKYRAKQKHLLPFQVTNNERSFILII